MKTAEYAEDAEDRRNKNLSVLSVLCGFYFCGAGTGTLPRMPCPSTTV
jgi:hypothetical protein